MTARSVPPQPGRGGTVALLLLALAVAPVAARAQASPYVPLDDPMLPTFEHLVVRGDVRDPSPMIRPIRRADLRRVLAEADTNDPVVHAVWRWYAEPDIETDSDTTEAIRYRVEGRAGLQAATQARRDLLHPAGDGSAWPMVDLRLEGLWGPVAVVARPGIENRVRRDPDWPGRRDNLFSGRLFEGYGSLQAGPARLTFGQLERNWGPVGLPGIPLSNVSYRRDGWALDIHSRRLQFNAYGSQLADERDSTGALVKRYFITKRLGVGVSDRLHLALWESTVLQGTDRSFESAYANPFSFVYTTITYGYGDRGTNNMLGLDLTWRAVGAHTVQAQLGLDDFWIDQRTVNRDRFAATAQLWGPLGRTLSYRATYSVVSAFALRTFVPQENFSDGGVGLGRNFTDNDQATLQVGIPVGRGWLLTPELTHFRQGEGSLRQPYPPIPLDPATNPTLFIGTVERTLRAAIGASGRQGPVQVLGNLGVHHVRNVGNQLGVQRTRIEARVQVLLAVGRAGWLQ